MRLLIFKVNQLGDNVVYLPVVQELRKKLTDWDITVFTSPVAEPLYRTACKGVEVQSFLTRELNDSWSKPWKLPALTSVTRKLKPDVCLFGDDQSNVAYLMGRLSGARQTIGPRWKNIPLTRLLTHPVSVDFDEPVAVQNWKLASALLAIQGLAPFASDLPPPPDLSAFGGEVHHGVLIHPGASSPTKRWPLERYVALANELSKTRTVHWITQGWDGEAALEKNINQVALGSLDSFIQLMAGSSLFVGNNSGPMNIAMALGVPSIIINGRSPSKWDPVWHADVITQLKDAVDIPADDSMAGAGWSVEIVHEMALAKLG